MRDRLIRNRRARGTRPMSLNPDPSQHQIVLVTGPSGAGRSTAIHALEDLGFEVIDNLPLKLLPRLLSGPPHEAPLALGIDVRNRDFSMDTLISALDRLAVNPNVSAESLYLDCHEDVLRRRYSETRRRHPLAPQATPDAGIRAELSLLGPVRARANYLIDTSTMSPHDLRAEIGRWFGKEGAASMSVLVQSFSYKRGLPRGADLVFDCRFLRNPHWEPALKALDGRDRPVADYVADDPRFAEFFGKLEEMALMLLPAYREEGKTALSIAIGCTGGQHRSVAVTEALAKALADKDWPVAIRHRELERRDPERVQEQAAPSGLTSGQVA